MDSTVRLQCSDFPEDRIGIQFLLGLLHSHSVARSGPLEYRDHTKISCGSAKVHWPTGLEVLGCITSTLSNLMQAWPTFCQQVLWFFEHTVRLANVILALIALLVVVDTVSSTLVGLVLYHTSNEADEEKSFGRSDTPRQRSPTSSSSIPTILVQLPMYNERQVYKRIIAAACNLDWPTDKLVVQVLDDSTQEDLCEGVRREVAIWQQRGCDVRYRKRKERRGYKAGNLREGLLEEYVAGCQYVAILDADFEPTRDWLKKTVRHLEADPSLALVQTRWTFSNERQCILTRFQALELRWHFLAEQLSGSYLMAYFGFNGTAGIWRLSAVLEAGGWSGDTVTEDMDMAVSAAGLGWRFKMLPHVECLSELPSTVAAYRKQQYRWTCGPASLLRKHVPTILFSKAVGWPRKMYMLGLYIGLRRIIRPLATAVAWLLFALSFVFPQQVSAPYWSLVALALLHPACYFAFSLRHLSLFPSCALFVSGLSPLRSKAVLAGLLDLSSARAWAVTQKMGRSPLTAKVAPVLLEMPNVDRCAEAGQREPEDDGQAHLKECVLLGEHEKKRTQGAGNRVFLLELAAGFAFLALSGGALFTSGTPASWWQHSLLALQGSWLLAFGLGLVGINDP